MPPRSSLNSKNSGVKRIMAEARELEADTSNLYKAHPLEDDIFDWHCTIRGPEGTEFEGGLYHARIVLPSEYPFKAPSVMLLTPNGRFELNKKICISFTAYHEDQWQPSWGVRTAIIGLQSFFPLKGEEAAGVGGIEVPIPERKRLAKLSREWVCPDCGCSNLEALPDAPVSPSSSTEEDSSINPTETSIPSDKAEEAKPEVKDEISVPEIRVEASPLLPDSSERSSRVEALPVPPQPTMSRSASPSSHTHTRPIDLTPSTPAARLLPPRPSAVVETMVLDPALAPKRAAPLWVDVAIAVLGVILVAVTTKRLAAYV